MSTYIKYGVKGNARELKTMNVRLSVDQVAEDDNADKNRDRASAAVTKRKNQHRPTRELAKCHPV